MSERIKNNIDYLNILSKCKPEMRSAILANADKDLIYAICECILNVLNGNIILNDDMKVKLRRQKTTLRELLKKKRCCLKKKKSILVQKGGSFLPFLLPTIIQTISSLIQ